jgi:hypothetical protein
MVLLDKVEKLTFCKGMPKEYYARLLSGGEFTTYPQGSYLFQEGRIPITSISYARAR